MLMAILTLLSGLLISAVAIFYSVTGLTNIFSAAPGPIIVMGISLELAKLVSTIWLKQNWNTAPKLLRTYLTASVILLMVITSTGIFGYLSKSHSDQSLISGDIAANISTYDLKIQTAKDNIATDKKALQQLDTAVDQIMSRSADTRGAQRSALLRKSQQFQRTQLQTDIETQQSIIAKTTVDSAPMRAQSRRVAAEVGPIKYIAQMIYGPNPSEDILEKAVSWVIILIVIVFDPLAITLLLASQYSFSQVAKRRTENKLDEFSDHDDLLIDLMSNVDLHSGHDEDIDSASNEDYSSSDMENDEDTYSDDSNDGDDTDSDEEYDDSTDGDDTDDDSNDGDDTGSDSDDGSDMKNDEDTYSDDSNDGDDTDSGTTITHNARGMVIEDSAGKQTISAYVQNEEQSESNVWSKIAKSITEQQYLEAAKKKRHGQ